MTSVLEGYPISSLPEPPFFEADLNVYYGFTYILELNCEYLTPTLKTFFSEGTLAGVVVLRTEVMRRLYHARLHVIINNHSHSIHDTSSGIISTCKRCRQVQIFGIEPIDMLQSNTLLLPKRLYSHLLDPFRPLG